MSSDQKGWTEPARRCSRAIWCYGETVITGACHAPVQSSTLCSTANDGMEDWQSGLMRLSREQEARERPGVRIPRLPYGKVSERSNVRAWRVRGATSPHRFESCPFRKDRALAERSMATGLNPVGAEAPVRSNRTRSGCPANVAGRSSRRA